MIPDKRKKLNENIELLTSYIENGIELDAFTLKGIVNMAESIDHEPAKMMLLGLAYGAAKKREQAVEFFKAGCELGDDRVVINYLSYLSHTGQYDLYRDETIRIARLYDGSPKILGFARNSSYADGDGELSLFFFRKMLSMLPEGPVKDDELGSFEMKKNKLDQFIEATKLETSDITILTRMIANMTAKYGIIAVSHEYYTSTDGSAAIICDVLCDDSDVISDMDIDIATELAMSEFFCSQNVTAWYRGRRREEVLHTS